MVDSKENDKFDVGVKGLTCRSRPRHFVHVRRNVSNERALCLLCKRVRERIHAMNTLKTFW